MKKILVVGQTPPPYGGQAVMIDTLLKGEYVNAKLFHVRMCFSKEMNEMGRFSFSKVFHLVQVIVKIFYFRVFHNVRVLYYPPCGPDRLPMLRDIAVLCSTRWMFKKTIFHFHAAGSSEIYKSLPLYIKILYRWAYFNPDITIHLSEFNPDDGASFKAKKKFLIPNGIVDDYQLARHLSKASSDVCNLLFVGLITESKGILVLIDAVKWLIDNGYPVSVSVVGKFESPEFKRSVVDKISELNLSSYFEFKGVLTGESKYQAFKDADVFCFPTFFESESFGLVVAEAMQFSLPVVVSRWRGVQSLVDDEVTGFLSSPHDADDVAKKIEKLILDPTLRSEMGRNGRKRYLEKYTVETFYDKVDRCFATLTEGWS